MPEQAEKPKKIEINRVECDKLATHIGQYTVLWRKKRKTVCRIESLDRENKKILYEVVSGQDKGDRIRSKYDTSQTIFVYTEEQLVLALLET